ncbi:hypothetical protein AX16_005789 [Volvariella volvacea WC 439]|nr:hypothetical protein AX16_005789 [Volvariella volvacea WC 439]
MPKKPKVVEVEDDSKYFTVYRPYPLNAAWLIDDHCKQFILWIATCIGTIDPIFALYHRPGSDSMVVVEIDKGWNEDDRLLGQHSWSKFLTKATPADNERVSQVFYSFYNSFVGLGKDGWKRVEVRQQWRKDWRPDNMVIRTPYPPTEWCSVPQVNMVGKNICRPLPARLAKPAPKAPPLVPGSAAWAQKNQPPTPVEVVPEPRRAAAPPAKANPTKSPVITPKTISLTTPARAPPKTGATAATKKQVPAWNGGSDPQITQSFQSSAFPALSTAPAAPATGPVWNNALPSNVKSPHTVPPAPKATVPILKGKPRKGSSSKGGAQASPPPPPVPAQQSPVQAQVAEVTANMEKLYAGDSDSDDSEYIPVPTGKKGKGRKAEESFDGGDHDRDDWGDGWSNAAREPGRGPSGGSGRSNVVYADAYGDESEEEGGDLWTPYYEGQTNQPAGEVCPVHGVVCGGRGICLDFARYLKQKKREEEAAAAQGEDEEAGWKNKKKKRRNRKKDSGGGQSTLGGAEQEDSRGGAVETVLRTPPPEEARPLDSDEEFF